MPRLWRSGMLRNLVPALPGWADVWYRPGAWLTEQTGRMVDTFAPTAKAYRRRHGLESEWRGGTAEEVCAGV